MRRIAWVALRPLLRRLSLILFASFTGHCSSFTQTTFERTYGGAGDDEGRSIQQTSDGGYIVAGYTSDSSIGPHDLYLVKTGPDGLVASAENAGNGLPAESALLQNYPNPFNPTTGIRYSVGGARDQGPGTRKTRLVVYDVLGRQVAMLVDEGKAPGNYQVGFDGSGLASGVYFYRMTAGSFVESRKK